MKFFAAILLGARGLATNVLQMEKSENGRLDRAVCILLLTAAFTMGCNSVDKMRGDGFSSAEDWGQELRGKQGSKASHGGFATKAQQIERNLGVE